MGYKRPFVTCVAVFLCTCSFATVSNAADIGMFALLGSPSHKHMYYPMIEALTNRGHNVTLYTLFPPTEKYKGLTEIQLADILQDYLQSMPLGTLINAGEANTFAFFKTASVFFHEFCIKILQSKEIQELLNKNEKVFDVGIQDGVLQDCFLPLVHKVSKSVIYSLTGNMGPKYQWKFNAPLPYSYIPEFYASNLTPKMNFYERLKNSVYMSIPHGVDSVQNEQEIQDLMPTGSLSVQESFDQVSLVFVNQHPAADYVIPSMPFIKFVGGQHIKQGESKPLEKDLQEFISGADAGFIYVSFGSVVPAERMPEEAKQALLDAFSRIPQRVVWKFNKKIEKLPPNIKLVNWIPQQTILAHPNLKAFITHGGTFSYLETVYHGVPIIGMPLFSDQFYTVNKAVYNGIGARLSWSELTSDRAVQTIQTIINDNSYKERIVERSVLFRDNLVHPLDEAVYWIEYLVRHPGTLHLRPDLAHLNTAQYLLLDVIALVLLVLAVTALISYKVIRRCFRPATRKTSRAKKTK